MTNSKFILGTVQLGLNYGINNSAGMPSKAVAEAILTEARQGGIQFLDTAAAYGTSEKIIGDYHRSTTGHRFSIITKFHHSEQMSVADQVGQALEKLGVEVIDTLMFHSFNDYRKNPQVFEELLSEREKGSIKKIGVSVYNNDEIVVILDQPDIEVIQLPFNLLDNDLQRGCILKAAKSGGKIIHTRSVYLQGLFFKTPAELPAKLKELSDPLTKLRNIAELAGLGLYELALAYPLSKPYIDNVLVGVETVEQLQSNLVKANTTLTEETVATVDALNVTALSLLNPSNW